MMRPRRLLGVLTLLLGGAAAAVVPAGARSGGAGGAGVPSLSHPLRVPQAAVTASLPGAVNGVAPGPDVLHRPPPPAPQLENAGIWEADPTLVCFASVYRAGEFLYQDCLWDDNGGGPAYRWYFYTFMKNYTYPTSEAYRNNAADIVEVRMKPLADAIAVRITYNTMTDPELVASTVALGDSAEPMEAPHGANTRMPARVFVTAHGGTGDIVDAATGEPLPERPVVKTDVERRQVEIRVPYDAFDPRGKTDVRVAAAAGLWDAGNDRYLVPRHGEPTDTEPGGAARGDDTPSAFFNVAFRYHEPHDAAWRDHRQLAAVEQGDISEFFAEVDFTKLEAGVDDDMTGEAAGIPESGYMSLLFASHFERHQGRRLPGDPGGPPPGAQTQQNGLSMGEGNPDGRPHFAFGWPCRDECTPDLASQLQRYMVYVPEAAPPPGGYPTLLWLNGYAINAGDQVLGERDLWQAVAERAGHPTLVVGTDARGADQWGYGQSGASNFETWADLARRFPLDPDRTVISGFSSGAYSANKLSLQFPDVFAGAFICDGLDVAPSFPTVNGAGDTLPVDTFTVHEPGSKLTPMLPSRSHQPVMEWAGSSDDFIPYNITRERADAYASGPYDYEFITWHGVAAEHLTMCNNGTWSVLNDWLGDLQRVENPTRVVYVRNPLMDDPGAGLVADTAYWLSGVEAREEALGTIDVTSGGFGRGAREAPGATTEHDSVASDGVTLGTGFTRPDVRSSLPANPYTREFRHLPSGPDEPASNTLSIRARNIRAVTIDPGRARVGCDAELDVVTDGPLTVTLLGCGGPKEYS